MLGLPLAFAAPVALAALVGLVALYFLLRMTPPRPREQRFPPLRLLLRLHRDRLRPKRPWPLLVLRLATAAAVVLAMAGPIWNAVKSASGGKGALLVVLDDGWPAAPTWEQRIAPRAKQARPPRSAGRLVALLPISDGGADVSPLDAAAFGDRLAALKPVPYAPTARRPAGGRRASSTPIPRPRSSGSPTGSNSAAPATSPTAQGACRRPVVAVAIDARTPVAITGLDEPRGALKAQVYPRRRARRQATGVVRAFDAQGRAIGEAPFDFGAGATAQVKFELPVELRNEISRLAICRRAGGRRGLAGRRALAAAPRRDRLRRQRRRRRAAALAASITSSARCSRSPKSASRRSARRTRSARCSRKSRPCWCSPT